MLNGMDRRLVTLNKTQLIKDHFYQNDPVFAETCRVRDPNWNDSWIEDDSSSRNFESAQFGSCDFPEFAGLLR
jgi:hypothetical protein